MSPGKVLVGQMIVVLGLALAGVWAATEYVAAALGYQDQLGHCWTSLFGVPVYRP